jgi:thiamine-phosphate pyrophosphorylase
MNAKPHSQPGETAASCRLCLALPEKRGADFAERLDDALSAGDVACLFVDPGNDPATLTDLIGIAQRHGVAAIVVGDVATARQLGADGVHIESGLPDLKTAVTAGRPGLMVGSGGIAGRDRAMRVGELDPDYLFFGRLDGDTGPHIFPKALDLATWWSDLFELPAVVMGGAGLDSVAEAAAAGIEFVCLRRAVWEHADGPAEAIRRANHFLANARAGAAT